MPLRDHFRPPVVKLERWDSLHAAWPTVERRLVAAVELISPSNKHGPEERRRFVTKCAELVRQDVSVVLVDLVTVSTANLYDELLAGLNTTDPSLGDIPPRIYAACLRVSNRVRGVSGRLETWFQPLTVGADLPTLPLWLSPTDVLPLNLETTHEELCRFFRLP